MKQNKKYLHIVLCKTAAHVTPEQIKSIKRRYRDCFDACNGMEWMAFGENVSQSPFATGWKHAIIMQFSDRTEQTAYMAHPLHIRLYQEAVEGRLFEDLADFGMEVEGFTPSEAQSDFPGAEWTEIHRDPLLPTLSQPSG